MMDINWSAKWIWDDKGSNPINYWLCFRHSFQTPGTFDSAILSISADSRYFAYLNGKLFGFGPARCWPFKQCYDTYKMKGKLKDGQNTIAVLINHYGVSTYQYVLGRGGLIAQLDFFYKEKKISCIYTNSSWKNRLHQGFQQQSIRINAAQPWMEIFDARRFEYLWMNQDYTDSKWKNSKEIGGYGIPPWQELEKRDIPHLSWKEMKVKRVLSFLHVNSLGQHLSIDLKPVFFPGNRDATDKKLLAFLALCIKSPKIMKGRIRLLSRNTIDKTDRIWVNGTEYRYQPEEDYKEVFLEQGNNYCLFDVSGYYQNFVVSYLFLYEENLSFSDPITGASNQLCTVGPFETGDLLNIMAIDIPLNYNNTLYQQIWKEVCSIGLLNTLKKNKTLVRTISQKSIITDNPHIQTVYKKIVKEIFFDLNKKDNIAIEDLPLLKPQNGTDLEITLDFGKEISAFIAIDLEAQTGVIIDMEFVESIHNRIVEYPSDMNSAMRYITREGHQSYQSVCRRGFRYLILTIRGAIEPVKIYSIKAYQALYPVQEKGFFCCSDGTLNKIWSIAQRTVKLCMEDTYVDCPAYEQTFWIGDMQLEALFNYYLFGAYGLTKRCIRLVIDSLQYSELPPSQVPSGCMTVLTAWVLLWMQSCRQYYNYSGDLKEIRRILPHLLLIADRLITLLDHNLLTIHAWNMLDWAPMDTPTDGIITHQNALLVKSLQDLAYLCSIIGDKKNGVRLDNQAEAIKEAINNHLWDEDSEAFIDCIHTNGSRSKVISLLTNTIVYLCECVHADKMNLIEDYLIHPPVHFVQIGSPFAYFFYLEALSTTGKISMVIDLIRKRWGEMLYYGATTCWENFPGWEKERLTRSHCHGWSAAPSYFFGAYILGVKPVSPGFKEVVIQPFTCGLKWAKGSVPTPKGIISVYWELRDGKFSIDVKAPEECKYHVIYPDSKRLHEEIRSI